MLDATTGLWEGRKRNPFAHYDRVGRVVTNNAHSFLMPARHELPLLNFCQEHSDHQICTILEHQLELRREAVVMGLTRLASTFCADMRGRFGTSFDEARIWIATADVPRWSQRYDGIKKPAFTDVATVELVDLPAHGVWR
ncbi:MAG: hypothetical protein KGZ57_06085 [Dethiobacter sp.]|nr:hypothetical protein [Dethiobacter sp.]